MYWTSCTLHVKLGKWSRIDDPAALLESQGSS